MAAPPSRPARNWAARVHEIAVAGIRAVVLENELLRVTVLAGLGSDVIEFSYKPRDLDATWLSPGGLRDPREITGSAADDVSAFLDHYRGGWQEVLPNGGAPSRYRGAALDVGAASRVRAAAAGPRLPHQFSERARGDSASRSH